LKKAVSFVPHLLTAGNLFCGVLALVSLGKGDYLPAAYLVLLAGVLDFFDGFAARALKVSGDFGKQLDSLADVVTFGAVPGVLLFYVFQENLSGDGIVSGNLHFLRYSPLLIAVFSGFRLAKFNIDERQSNGFIGLPTPANTFWIISIVFLLGEWPEETKKIVAEGWTVLAFTALSCYLLVAEIPLMSLKVKGFAPGENRMLYILLFICLVALILFKFTALAVIIPLYIIFSLIENRLKKA
jgi:CDP-diacylglycerol--serine O-phosphatidyltransferase